MFFKYHFFIHPHEIKALNFKFTQIYYYSYCYPVGGATEHS